MHKIFNPMATAPTHTQLTTKVVYLFDQGNYLTKTSWCCATFKTRITSSSLAVFIVCLSYCSLKVLPGRLSGCSPFLFALVWPLSKQWDSHFIGAWEAYPGVFKLYNARQSTRKARLEVCGKSAHPVFIWEKKPAFEPKDMLCIAFTGCFYNILS